MDPKTELANTIEAIEAKLVKHCPWYRLSKHHFARKVIKEVLGFSPYDGMEALSEDDIKTSICALKVMNVALRTLKVVKAYR